jgi:Amt family ammonium transporter
LIGKQTVAVLAASVWAFAFTYGMLAVINKITPVKVSEADEATGLDTALHSEQAYDLDSKSV